MLGSAVRVCPGLLRSEKIKAESEKLSHFSLYTYHLSLNLGGLAQLVEHLPCTQGVKSSSLLSSTLKLGIKLSIRHYSDGEILSMERKGFESHMFTCSTRVLGGKVTHISDEKYYPLSI